MYVWSELAAEAVKCSRKHPRGAMLASLVSGVIALRTVWLLVWWVLFGPTPVYALNGSITCDGMPLAEGSIALEPVGALGIASRTAHVRDGQFKLDKANGVVIGVEYLLRVEGFRKTGTRFPGAKPGEFSDEMEQFVLPTFNRDSSSRVKISRSVLREGLKYQVQGAPVSARPSQKVRSRR